MTPDFNNEFKGFVEESKVCSRLLAELRADKSFAQATPAAQASMEALAKAAFESMSIFFTLVPNQMHAISRSPLSHMMHEFNSAEARAVLSKGMGKVGFGHQSEFVKTFSCLALTRPGELDELAKEITQRGALAAKAGKRKPAA